MRIKNADFLKIRALGEHVQLMVGNVDKDEDAYGILLKPEEVESVCKQLLEKSKEVNNNG